MCIVGHCGAFQPGFFSRGATDVDAGSRQDKRGAQHGGHHSGHPRLAQETDGVNFHHCKNIRIVQETARDLRAVTAHLSEVRLENRNFSKSVGMRSFTIRPTCFFNRIGRVLPAWGPIGAAAAPATLAPVAPRVDETPSRHPARPKETGWPGLMVKLHTHTF